MIYSDDAAATRAFFRDVLGWNYFEHGESGQGWLIFNSGPSEMGVHPTSGEQNGQSFSSPRHHSISFMCDDINLTMAELSARGATFNGDVNDYGFGLCVMMAVPGADDVMLYQPLYEPAFTL
jgi:catechol 2,3-dioxygenase-like lactoylglutathione lyase family enzyme